MTDEEKKAIEKIKKILYMFPESEELKLLLNLIEKQQKEIEELKVRNFDLETMLTSLNSISIDKKYVKNNYISKDKIKAKIEEVENEYTGCTTNVFSVLQSLLEKE